MVHPPPLDGDGHLNMQARIYGRFAVTGALPTFSYRCVEFYSHSDRLPSLSLPLPPPFHSCISPSSTPPLSGLRIKRRPYCFRAITGAPKKETYAEPPARGLQPGSDRFGRSGSLMVSLAEGLALAEAADLKVSRPLDLYHIRCSQSFT